MQVYRGDGTRYANTLRADVLRVSQGRSVTLGNRIFLGDADRNRFAVLAHEVHHTVQYQRWGAVQYYNRGVGERISELLGVNPYEYSIDGRRFEEYGMEQQGQIVADLVDRKRGVRSIPGVPKVGP